MSEVRRPVVVGVDGSVAADAAIEWAVAEARSLNCRVRLVNATGDQVSWAASYGRAPVADYAQLKVASERLLAAAAAKAQTLAPEVAVETVSVGDTAVRALLDEAGRAGRVVVGSRHLRALGSAVLGSVGSGVAARASCPVVVVRGPAGLSEEEPAVVVGVEPAARSQAVLEFAFDFASRRRRPLAAVLCWHRDPLAEMAWRAAPVPPPQATEWLSEALSGWREQYPDVLVRTAVVRANAAEGLIGAAAAQELLVVGARGQRPVLGALLGSVTQGVLHHASCPVAVVPAAVR